MKTIRELQTEVHEWSKRFGMPSKRLRWTALGVLEELGEFVHALAKAEHGHRGGTPEYWEKEKQDAIADSLVFMLDHCACMDWDIAQAVHLDYGPTAAATVEAMTLRDVQALAAGSRHHISWGFLDHLMNAATNSRDDHLTVFFNHDDVGSMLMNWGRYCDRQGWDLQEIFERVWDHVRTRDQEKRKVEG